MQSNRSRGQMIPRGLNKWLLRVCLGKDPLTGKWKYDSRIFKGTTSQARKELTALHRSLDTQTFVQSSKLTLGEYLTAWLTGKIDVTGATRESYDRQLAYFTEALRLRLLTEVTTDDVQRVLNAMLVKGLSRRTLQYARAVLHIAFEDAIQRGLLVRNPVKTTLLPPRVKRAPTVLSVEQMNLFLEVNKDSAFYPLWILLLTTGLRPQEALALKWSDLNLTENWLSVQRALVDTGSGHYELVEATKTEGSTRRIGLPESTSAALRTHRKVQATDILAAGALYKRLDLVFAAISGGPLDISSIRRSWKACCKAAKLPIVRLYDTRHTHLTALLAAGADIAWVSARAGHKNITMTRDHYAHVMPETHREMGEMTERLLKVK